jgi:excisionase family DNA binding protein
MNFMQKKSLPPIQRKLQSRDETAAQLGIHVRSLDKLIRAGTIETIKVGRRVMVRCSSAARFVDSS